jgi:PTS system fructose-specific IIC component/PTS system nitrogen regulatory IIA component
MLLNGVFTPKAVKLSLESETKDEVFEELVEVLVAAHPEINRAQALQALLAREAKMSTGIIKGIAVPHGKIAGIKGVFGAVGISRQGIDYESLDGEPVNVIFMLLTDTDDYEYHLNVLKRLSRLLDLPTFISSVLEKRTQQEVYDVICKFESRVEIDT